MLLWRDGLPWLPAPDVRLANMTGSSDAVRLYLPEKDVGGKDVSGAVVLRI